MPVPASNQPQAPRERRAGGGEAGRPVRQAGVPVREQFDRLRRAFGSPVGGSGAGEPGGRGRRRAGRVARLAVAALAVAVAASLLPRQWPGPKLWGANRNWLHGGVCYYRDFAHRDRCLTAPPAVAVRTPGRT